MKSESVIALVFRIAGLLLAVQSLAFIPSVLMATTTGTFRTEPTWPYVLPQVFGLVSGLIAAYVLFRHGRWLARRVVSEDEHLEVADMSAGRADTAPVFRLFLRILGAFVVALAVPELVGHGFGRVMLDQMQYPVIWSQIAPAVVKLAIGVYLLKGGPDLVRFAYGSESPSETAASV